MPHCRVVRDPPVSHGETGIDALPAMVAIGAAKLEDRLPDTVAGIVASRSKNVRPWWGELQLAKDKKRYPPAARATTLLPWRRS